MPRRFASFGIARAFTLALALASVAMLLASGPGTRLGLWTWQTGFAWVKWGFYAGAGAGVCALVMVALLALPRFRARPWIPVLSLCLALGAIVPPLALLSQAKNVPRIHDISTDTDDPPAFVTLLPQRQAAPNGFAYGGAAIAAEQHRGYPGVKPLLLPTPPAQALRRALDAAHAMGWEVAAADASAGRIEATATSAWFGFKDDIVVRIRPDGTGSRVDVRSVSRVGLSDLGANARRIEEFLARLG